MRRDNVERRKLSYTFRMCLRYSRRKCDGVTNMLTGAKSLSRNASRRVHVCAITARFVCDGALRETRRRESIITAKFVGSS